jgi:hypothetical protein
MRRDIGATLTVPHGTETVIADRCPRIKKADLEARRFRERSL